MVSPSSDALGQQDLAQLLTTHRQWLEQESVPADPPVHQGRGQLRLQDRTIFGVSLRNESLFAAEFVRVSFDECRFVECDLSNSILVGSTMSGSSLVGCRFVKADLREVRADGATLSRSNLTRADLTDASLVGANLSYCRLDQAWLVNCDLRNADLTGTSFKRARLIGAKLYNDRRFPLGDLDEAVVQNADLTPDGNGTDVSSGAIVFDRLASYD